ncbi:MAG: hypothetical protein RQ729_09285 [Wenzhouxiangellaceae bacterium]|nr:hypothetical protein [Wenzhouxiangellaceae bacterium]
MPQSTARLNDRLRRQVAAEAARILATEGQRNYGSAKNKAATRLGVRDRAALPSNREIEDELKRYQALYGGDEHGQILTALREAAVEAMEFFQRFRPRLVGPVLEGTADNHSRISLHLFCDTPEEVVSFLHQQRIAFEQETRRIRDHDGGARTLELLVIEAGGQCFELALMIGPGGRAAPPDPVRGTPQRRAGIDEVRRLAAGQDYY